MRLSVLPRLAMMQFLLLLLLGSACGGTVYIDGGDGSVDAESPFDAGDADAGSPDSGPDADLPDSGSDAGLPDSGSDADSPDSGSDADSPDAESDAGLPDSGGDAGMDDPLAFNIIFRQSVQACSSCGIWFDWQDVDSQKARLVVEYQHQGQTYTAEYQHGLDGMDNAHSIFFSPSSTGHKHALLVKQAPLYNGLFRADISDIPTDASIVSASLHLHIHTDEGLAYSDLSSVLDVHACDKAWNWDQLSWSNYDSGMAWDQSGGDFGQLIRQIRAKEDMRDRGFSKANPNAHFDFTAHVQQLQAER